VYAGLLKAKVSTTTTIRRSKLKEERAAGSEEGEESLIVRHGEASVEGNEG
jgi:hypothetical protein